MSYDRTAPKCGINVSLNQDLVRQARLYTRNCGTLEDLLDEFVTGERVRRRDEDTAVGRVMVRWTNSTPSTGFCRTSSRRFGNAWHRAEQGKTIHERHLAFGNWDALARVLTATRRELPR